MAEYEKERRLHARTQVQLGVLCSSGTERGYGTLVNISRSGALLEPTSIRPRLGAPVEVRFQLADDSSVLKLVGTLVRHTSLGFAIRFAEVDQVLRQLPGIIFP